MDNDNTGNADAQMAGAAAGSVDLSADMDAIPPADTPRKGNPPPKQISRQEARAMRRAAAKAHAIDGKTVVSFEGEKIAVDSDMMFPPRGAMSVQETLIASFEQDHEKMAGSVAAVHEFAALMKAKRAAGTLGQGLSSEEECMAKSKAFYERAKAAAAEAAAEAEAEGFTEQPRRRKNPALEREEAEALAKLEDHMGQMTVDKS